MPGWAWQPPDAKPGVIPLRPLGVGEILDGAVTTIRRNPGAMLGLSAIVAIVSQLFVLGATWVMFRDLTTLEQLDASARPEEILDSIASSFAAFMLSAFITWIATVFLTGVLTVVVGRAVLGERLTIGEAWRQARGRLLRLLGLTFVYTLYWTGAILAVLALTVALGVAGSDAAVIIMVVGLLVAVPIGVWLFVRYSLAGPALVLESTTGGNGGPRPVGIATALRRSAELVRGSWWRVFGILVLVNIIVIIITQVIAVPFGIPSVLTSGGTYDVMTFGALSLSALGGVVSATLTAPFSAGATALLYIDRRIRREGLDIELARAVGVELPNRGYPGSHSGPR